MLNANEMGLSSTPSWIPPAIGFLIALFLFMIDKIIPHLHIFAKEKREVWKQIGEKQFF